VDFLVNRSKLFQSGRGGDRPKQPPLVRPGLEIDASSAQPQMHSVNGKVTPLAANRKH
jgi:hypothetical protein